MRELSAQDIKDIRKKYGLSQKSFAKLLGIGEASIARYETGAVPTRANKNLISAAADPSFMAECLKHDEGEVMEINELFEIDMMREGLNERAAQLVGELFDQIGKAEAENDQQRLATLNLVLGKVGEILPTIVMHENASFIKQTEIQGKLAAFESIVRGLEPPKVA